MDWGESEARKWGQAILTCYSHRVRLVFVVEVGVEGLLDFLQRGHLYAKNAAAPHLSNGVSVEEHIVAL